MRCVSGDEIRVVADHERDRSPIALPGQEPVRLRPTEDQGIEPGTVISLADEVTLVYEVDA